MTLRVPKFLVRRWGGPKPDGTIDGKELHQHTERFATEVERITGEIAESIPGDRRDTITVTSRGPGEKIRAAIPKKILERKPDSYIVVHQDGAGAIWPDASLTDGKNVVLNTDSVAGTKFRILVYREQR